MTRVLAFGDDRSPGADGCWEWITSHHWQGWRLEVITAEPPADMHPIEEEESTLHTWEPEDPRRPDDRGFSSVDHLRAKIDPRLALISKPWDLVAIGPRGTGMLKSLHLGSTADWLVREPASPLLVARQPDPVEKVLVAADGSPHSQRAVETLVALPWLEGVAVHVVSVDDGRVDVEAALSSVDAILSKSGVDVDSATSRGSATDAIVEEIERTEPDLIVLGAKGRGGFRRLIVGSTTAAIAGSVDRSILVAHALGETDG